MWTVSRYGYSWVSVYVLTSVVVVNFSRFDF